MTDRPLKIEESHEVRQKRRMSILKEVFEDFKLVEDDKLAFDGTESRVVGKLVKVMRTVFGKPTTVAYIEYCVTRGERYDELHINFAPIEPIALEVVEKFQDDGVDRISYDMPAMVVIVHYRHDKVVADPAYKQAVIATGRKQAIQLQLARLEQEALERGKEQEQLLETE